MKFITILIDGASDNYIEEIGGTPLEVAYKPNINKLAERGEVGLCKTVPTGMSAGSDTANLSVMGYNPEVCYTGRSPIEAVSMGIKLKDTDMTFRANLVTLSEEEEYQNKKMLDYSAGEISTIEAEELINYVSKELNTSNRVLHSGISYRHCFVFDKIREVGKLTPPHDIWNKTINEYLPTDKEVLDIMKQSYELLKCHPINLKRKKEGKNPANSLWLWGMGTKPILENHFEKYQVKGGVISAVDLIKGIGILGGMKIIEVEGATGNIHTNFKGKSQRAIEELQNGLDFVYLHLEAPDECSHQGDLKNKIKSLEIIDKEVVEPIVKHFEKGNERYKILIMPDHPTPVELKTHTGDSVPYILFDSENIKSQNIIYSEKTGKESGIYYKSGEELIKKFFSK